MQLVSWRYSEPNSWAMCRRPAGSWGYPAPCFTGGKIDMSATVGMGFTRDGTKVNEDAHTVCRCRTSRRFWRSLFPTPPVDPVFTRCTWLEATATCRPVLSTVRCDAWGWALGSSASLSWSNTALNERDCSRNALDATWHAPEGRNGMWRPTSPASSSVWTPSTSADSKAWARSGRSRLAMRPARTLQPVSSRPIRLNTLLASLPKLCCQSTKLPDGPFSGSSPIGVASLGARLMPPVRAWRSAIRGRNPDTHGPTASSNVSKERSSTSIGVWPSAGDTSRSVVSSNGPCKFTWPFTTTNDPIKDTGHVA